jgi:hypothetical protein
MSLRVAFDLDGTVADMYSALYREAEVLFGAETLAKARYRDPAPVPKPGSQEPKSESREPRAEGRESGKKPREDEPDTAAAMQELHLTARQQMQLWDHVKKIENFWTTLPEMEPGIIARLARMATERRWEVVFLTTRPPTAGETTQLQSQRWLDAHGFPFPSVYVVQRSRGKIADALRLDAVVDDRPENCLDVAVESAAKALLVWHGNLKDVPAGAQRLGVRAVQTIGEAVTLLEQYDEMRRQPGVIRSLKRVLGRSTEG